MQTPHEFFPYSEFSASIIGLTSCILIVLVVLAVLRIRHGRWAFRRYKSIVDSAPDALSLVDRQYVYRLVNREYLRRTGLARKQIEGRSVAEVLGTEAFQNLIQPNLDRALAGEAIQFEAWFEFAALGRRRMLVNYWPYPESSNPAAIEGVLVSARDVTELWEADDARRSAEIRLRDLLEHSPGIICIKDLRRRFLMVNRAAEALLQGRRDDIIGKTLEQVVPSASAAAVAAFERRVIETRQPETVEQTLSDGTMQYTLLSTMFLLRDHLGEPNALCNIALDISQRKRVEQALEVTLAKYQTLFNQFPLGIVVTDADGRVLEINPASQRVMGGANALRIGDPIQQLRQRLLQADGTPMSIRECPIERALREQRLVTADEIGLRREDGDVVWLSVTATPLPVLGYGVVAACKDITEQKRARDDARQAATLRDSERRFRTMADGLSSLVWVTDATGELAFVNQRYLEFFGLGEDAVAGSAWSALVHPDDLGMLSDKFSTGLRDHRRFSLQCRLRRADGEWRWFESFARPRWSDAGVFEGFVGSSRDITRRKRVEQALRCSRREIKQRSEQLGRLAGELTRAEQGERRRLGKLLHDHLQQLLVGASLATNRVARRINADGANEAGADIDRVAALLDEAIDASRTLMADLCPPILYEAGLADALHWLARSMHEKYRLTVTLDLDTTVAPTDQEMRVFLFESVREALFNVVKHAGVLTARVALTRDDQTELRLQVSDAGTGFDATSMYQGESQSDGLGLVAMRERMRLLGGRLEIDSAPGQGTCLSLYAPLAPLAPLAESVAATDADWSAPSAAESDDAVEPTVGVGVLLVDDHLVMRDGLSALLEEEAGVRVVGEASNGQEAIDKVAELLPDLVLMDFSMPVMDGVQATRIIHERWPGIPVIGLSLYQEADRAEAMREAGAVDYVCKTSVTDELLDKIRQHASKRPEVLPPPARESAIAEPIAADIEPR